MALKYPAQPWKNGQKAELMQGMYFMYSSAIRKWVPISPGFENEQQLVQSFGVSTVQELNAKFEEVNTVTTILTTRTEQLDSDIQLSGRIWKTISRPTAPNNNDVWMEQATGKLFSYDATHDTWVEK